MFIIFKKSFFGHNEKKILNSPLRARFFSFLPLLLLLPPLLLYLCTKKSSVCLRISLIFFVLLLLLRCPQFLLSTVDLTLLTVLVFDDKPMFLMLLTKMLLLLMQRQLLLLLLSLPPLRRTGLTLSLMRVAARLVRSTTMQDYFWPEQVGKRYLLSSISKHTHKYSTVISDYNYVA